MSMTEENGTANIKTKKRSRNEAVDEGCQTVPTTPTPGPLLLIHTSGHKWTIYV